MPILIHYIKTFFQNQFMLAVFILGGVLLFLGMKSFYHYYFSNYSIPVTATVVETKEIITTNSGGRRNTSYVLKYTYTLNGVTYQSDRYRHSHSTPRDVLQYKPGDTLKALVSSEQPGDAVIVSEFTWTNILGIILGSLLMVGSLIIHGKMTPGPRRKTR